MLYAKRKYDRNLIINKCLRFYDLKSNKRYILLWTLVKNLQIKQALTKCEGKFEFFFSFQSLSLCGNIESILTYLRVIIFCWVSFYCPC